MTKRENRFLKLYNTPTWREFPTLGKSFFRQTVDIIIFSRSSLISTLLFLGFLLSDLFDFARFILPLGIEKLYILSKGKSNDKLRRKLNWLIVLQPSIRCMSFYFTSHALETVFSFDCSTVAAFYKLWKHFN